MLYERSATASSVEAALRHLPSTSGTVLVQSHPRQGKRLIATLDEGIAYRHRGGKDFFCQGITYHYQQQRLVLSCCAQEILVPEVRVATRPLVLSLYLGQRHGHYQLRQDALVSPPRICCIAFVRFYYTKTMVALRLVCMAAMVSRFLHNSVAGVLLAVRCAFVQCFCCVTLGT